MAEDAERRTGLLSDISDQLAGIFRHLLPGVLVVGTATLAYPDQIRLPAPDSWQTVLVFAVVTITVGNTWFALNRYGLHQVVDYVLYLLRSNGPARAGRIRDFTYLDDLAKYTDKSLHTPKTSRRAADHVRLRASTVLLALTFGELLALAVFFHSQKSHFADHRVLTAFGAGAGLAVGFWQMIITRRIDYYVVHHKD